MLFANQIELLKSLSELNVEETYTDLHNDYVCDDIRFDRDVLILKFRHITLGNLFSIEFHNTAMEHIDFNIGNITAPLTIDSLYRGRCERQGNLTEFENQKGYFYLEFYEGQKMEFWCEYLVFQNHKSQ